MCGILGTATSSHSRLALNKLALTRLRDMLTHRGPDAAGFWQNNHVALTHRRLAIIDPEHGQQPFHVGAPNTPGHVAISYNGEIYNHLELRKELQKLGHTFQTTCDTETVAHAFAQWGKDAFHRFRGMFAIAAYNHDDDTLTLARDPLGIKPLYYALIQAPHGTEIAFASEPPPILAHPYMPLQPDWVTVSSYMTTIRTTLGRRTMYEGLKTLLPGEIVTANLQEQTPRFASEFQKQHTAQPIHNLREATEQTKNLITDSVNAHLLADVPTCTLLSGGIDSSIISAIAVDKNPQLHTYCSGAYGPENGEDFHYAKTVAKHINTQHTEAPVTDQTFAQLWPWMIQQLGVPLSTPNEVAIYTVAQALSPHAKVALSGEGADELFAGYDAPLIDFANYIANPFDEAGNAITPAAHYLQQTSWIPIALKPQIFNPDVFTKIDDDMPLIEETHKLFQLQGDDELSMRSCLRAQQHFNLTGLLSRLDTATMLASVEGRTPFADAHVAAFAQAQTFDHHFAAQTTDNKPTRSKRLLRDAFANRLPQSVTTRPKASFPLPFQSWMSSQSESLATSSVAAQVFHPQVIAQVIADPATHWTAAWPMINLSIWLEQNWGAQAQGAAA